MKHCMQNIPKYDRAMVKKYGRTLGYFDGMRPNLWTTDLELIKSIFVKDFDHFINRRVSLLSPSLWISCKVELFKLLGI